MLNLSDKELDRFSREAAEEHNPGNILGPKAWDKLETRLDVEFGKATPNPFGRFRRLPFYYTPAVLLILGVSYYFIRQTRHNESTGSPPSTSAASQSDRTNKYQSSQSPSNNTNSTPAPSATSVTVPYPGSTAQQSPDAPTSSTASASSVSAPTSSSTAGSSTAGTSSASTSTAGTSSAAGTSSTSGAAATSPHSSLSAASSASTSAATPPPASDAANHTGSLSARTSGTPGSSATLSGNALVASSNLRNTRHTSGNTAHGYDLASSSYKKTSQGKSGHNKTDHTTHSNTTGNINNRNNSDINTTGIDNNSDINSLAATNNTTGEKTIAAPTLSSIQHYHSLKGIPRVPDSALRAFIAKNTPSLLSQKQKQRSLYINRSLRLGLTLAPDFSSVKSLAGDKPGSTIGITADYEILNHFYVGSGFLVSRKNYAARAADFHVPKDYYQMNSLPPIDFIKGSMNMIEIPLNLRYDFTTSGTTMFFAQVGSSSYLMTGENCNYYYNWFGYEKCQGFNYNDRHFDLFSSINLSLGVETALSNSLSVLIAPYVKIPSRNIGFGQVPVSSVGINFALEFAPVISRKRK